MAGSYAHATTDSGALRDPESFADTIENLGDAYEACEEMYGMTWYLASAYSDASAAVELARQNYRDGLDIARRNTRA